MDVIKRKVLLENSIDRTNNSPNWGVLTADTFFFNILITQNADDMGLFTDMEFISGDSVNSSVDYSVLTNKLASNGYYFPFMIGITPSTISASTTSDEFILRLTSKTESDYYNYGNFSISGNTDSKIEDVSSYDYNEKFKVGFDINAEAYINYANVLINGVDKVVSVGEPTIYAINANNDVYIGSDAQTTGIKYQDYSAITRSVKIDGIETTVPLTIFSYISEGYNETNLSLSAITKEEYLFGIISKPEIESDVFIERGVTSVFEPHLILSEINNLGELTRYGNGYYNIRK